MKFLSATNIIGRGNVLIIPTEDAADIHLHDRLTFEVVGIEKFSPYSSQVGLVLSQR